MQRALLSVAHKLGHIIRNASFVKSGFVLVGTHKPLNVELTCSMSLPE